MTWAIPCHLGQQANTAVESLLEETNLLVWAGSGGSLGSHLGPRALPLWSFPASQRVSLRSLPCGRSSFFPCQGPHPPVPSRAVLAGGCHSVVPKLPLGESP